MLACLRERSNLIEKTQQPEGQSRFLGEGAVDVLRQGEGLQGLLDWIVTHEKNVKEVNNREGRLHHKQMLFTLGLSRLLPGKQCNLTLEFSGIDIFVNQIL